MKLHIKFTDDSSETFECQGWILWEGETLLQIKYTKGSFQYFPLNNIFTFYEVEETE